MRRTKRTARVRRSFLASIVVVISMIAPAAATEPDPVRFAEAEALSVGSTSGTATEIADVTGEGRADLLVTSWYDDSPDVAFHLWLYKQKVDGTLTDPESYEVPIGVGADNIPMWLAVGDLDDDGDDDDVAVSTDLGLSVFTRAAGTFSGPVAYGASGIAWGVHAADVSGDGVDDLVYVVGGATFGQNRYVARIQQAGGGFGAPVQIGAGAAFRFSVGDLDRDARVDFVMHDDSSDGITILFQQADHSFVSTPYEQSARVNSSAIGDVTGDGINDLVTGGGIFHLTVIRGRADGTLATPVEFTTVESPDAIEIADMNHDGFNDVVAVSAEGTSVAIQRSDGTLTEPCAYTRGFYTAGDESLAVGDLDADGRPDEAMAVWSDTGVLVTVRRHLPIDQRMDAQLTLEVEPSLVELGESVSAEAHLSFPGGGCLDHGMVDIYETLPGGAPTKIASVSGDPYNQFHWAFTAATVPEVTGEIQYSARWVGGAVHQSAQSSTVAVTVVRAPSSVSLALTKQKVTFGGSTKLTSVLTGGDTNRDVEFYGTVGGIRSLLDVVTADESGLAELVVEPHAKTTYQAKYAGDASIFPDVSTEKVVTVVPLVDGEMRRFDSRSGSFAIYRRSQNVYYWTRVTPRHPGNEVVVFLDYRGTGSWRRSSATRVELGLTGSVTAFIPASEFPPGYDWRFRTRFVGDGDHLLAYSDWQQFRIADTGKAASGTNPPRVVVGPV